MNVLALLIPLLQLPGLQVREVTVSGLSSGAFMSVQMSVAHSSLIDGSAIFAGGPHGCARGRAERAVMACMQNPEWIDVPALVRETKQEAALGLIDDPAFMSRQSALILQGDLDETVRPAAALKLDLYLRSFGVKTAVDRVKDLGHGLPVMTSEVTCSDSRPPWVNGCGIDGPGRALRFLYGELNAPVEEVHSSLFRFSQKDYISERALMAEDGYVYIPQVCREPRARCRLHVVLHGCRQNPEAVGEALVRDAGYNRWAEANQLVILYPAVRVSLQNPRGCWDWWGYSGLDYATRNGAQMQALENMIQALISDQGRAR